MWISDSNQPGELENLTWNDGLCAHSGNSSGCSLVLKQSFNFNRYFNVLWLTKFVEHRQPPNMTEKHSRLVWFRGRWPFDVVFCFDDIGCSFVDVVTLPKIYLDSWWFFPWCTGAFGGVLSAFSPLATEPKKTTGKGSNQVEPITMGSRQWWVFKVHHFSWNSWSQLEGFSWHLGLGLFFLFVSVRKIGYRTS